MSKQKRTNWSRVPWTPFESCVVKDDPIYTALNRRPDAIFKNSRYQVSAWFEGDDTIPVWGKWVHLSLKVHDRQAHHDWRDMQRIKNELVGPEYEAIEVYPAESKLVDTCNQYHLFVFRDLRLPFGFQARLVSDGSWQRTKQRPFDVRPADCLSSVEFEQLYRHQVEHK